MPPGEGPQEAAQRGRGPYPAEQARQTAVPQEIQVVDAVHARHY
ncbi:hypothetical protein [Streptomyces sp. NBC_00289]